MIHDTMKLVVILSLFFLANS